MDDDVAAMVLAVAAINTGAAVVLAVGAWASSRIALGALARFDTWLARGGTAHAARGAKASPAATSGESD